MAAHLTVVDEHTAPPSPRDAFRTYSGYVAALAYKLLGSEAEVDDLVQDVFLIALDKLGQLRHGAATKSWLGTLTVRQAAKRLRFRKVVRFIGLEADQQGDPFESSAASPEQRAMLGEVYRVLERLPVAQRLAWTLRFIEGEQLDEVARLCGCSLATVKRRIAAAQQALEVIHVEA